MWHLFVFRFIFIYFILFVHLYTYISILYMYILHTYILAWGTTLGKSQTYNSAVPSSAKIQSANANMKRGDAPKNDASALPSSAICLFQLLCPFDFWLWLTQLDEEQDKDHNITSARAAETKGAMALIGNLLASYSWYEERPPLIRVK